MTETEKVVEEIVLKLNEKVEFLKNLSSETENASFVFEATGIEKAIGIIKKIEEQNNK